ncbi:MAG: NAD(P)H-quinone oxidoreductase subunit 4 [Cyanobacteria bacterium CRU_2_1]|nr:NAD(P)H-quinone oxidoreductase subunit 4 [Cyanobacteria bacterium RU_5_0]NJR59560.1 NAD(P)H-quinone oxidoreductase subunit 4 [Cyanobacteria bacterium CRU_2_1]
MGTQFPWLTVLILFPLLASLPIPFLPDKEGKTVRSYTLAAGLAEFALIIYAFWKHYDLSNPSFQLVENYAWVPQIGLNWSLAVDGLSMPLVILTGLVTTLAIFASWKISYKPRLFYFLMLTLYSAQIGVFVAQDLLLFFMMWELELVPVYLLIATWGGERRLYAATKFILYTAIASIFILVAALAMAFYGGDFTFSLYELGLKDYSLGFEILVYSAFLIAFGVKLPIFPFHTWLPDAHSEAPAPVSMILAGVLLKMGGYALIRFNVEMLPNANVYFAPVLAVLGVVGVIYASLAAFAQTNLKRRLAYSSIAHMGFVLIGMASFTDLGMSGAVLQMVSHGLIAASLFFLSGVAYERTHTLMMDEMGGMAKQMPTTFALFTAGAMASLALPGMSGFVGELEVFLGFANSDVYSSTFKAVIITLAAIGVILSPIYLLSMLRNVFYGQENAHLTANVTLTDTKPREAFIALCLLVPIIGIGLYPKLATQTYDMKTVAVTAEARNSLPLVAEHPFHITPPFTTPTVLGAETKELVHIVQ